MKLKNIRTITGLQSGYVNYVFINVERSENKEAIPHGISIKYFMRNSYKQSLELCDLVQLSQEFVIRRR